MKEKGEARSANTGSVIHQPPRSFISSVEWPRRYRLRSGAAARSAGVSRCTGRGAAGSVSFGLLKKKSHITLASGWGALAGRGWMLRKRPADDWGDWE